MPMTILKETARLVKEKQASEYDALTAKRVMMGMFYSGVNLSNGFDGFSYTPIKDILLAIEKHTWWYLGAGLDDVRAGVQRRAWHHLAGLYASSSILFWGKFNHRSG